MARLPTPGSDNGTWGNILNDFLGQAHNNDGSLKPIPQNKITSLTDDLASLEATVNSKATPGQIATAINDHVGAANPHAQYLTETVAMGTYAAHLGKFGAAGDGVTDDTAAIGAALDAVGVAGGGTLFVPAGKVYRYSSIVKTVDGVTITGGGTLRSTLDKTSNTIAFHLIGNNNTIDGITFDYTVPVVLASADVDNRGANGKTIRLGGTAGPTVWKTNLAVINCTIRDARNTAIDIYYGDRVLISGNTIERSLGNGMFITNCLQDLRIIGNSIYDVGDDGIFVAADGNLPARTKGVIITGNTIELCDAKCIGLGGVDGGTIANNTLKKSYAPAIQLINDSGLMENSHKVAIIGNVIEEAGTCYGGGRLHDTVGTNGSAIELNNAPEDISVTGNTIVGAQKLGISVTSGGSRLNIASNMIDNCGSFGIELGNAGLGAYNLIKDVTIFGNSVHNVRAGGIIVGGGANVHVADNTVRSYDGGATGDTWGIFWGWLEDSLLHDNHVINDDSATYGIRMYPTSVNPQTRLWNNQTLVTGAGVPVTEMSLGSARNGWYTCPRGSVIAAVSLGVNATTFQPVDIPIECIADRIAAEITTIGSAGAVVRLGIYASKADGFPGSLILDAGTFAADGTIGIKEITISQKLGPGRYWLTASTQIAASTLRSTSGDCGAGVSHSTTGGISSIQGGFRQDIAGALPANAVITSVTGNTWRVVLRLTVP